MRSSIPPPIGNRCSVWESPRKASNMVTTSNVIAVGFGLVGLVLGIANLYLKAHHVSKEKARVVWMLVAVAWTIAAGTVGYTVASRASSAKPSAVSATAGLVGPWSGTYTVDGVEGGLKMRITS